MNKLTKDLIGLELDWAVAKCEGLENSIRVSTQLGIPQLLKNNGEYYSPSTTWSQGGLIIEREVHNLFKWNQIEPGPEIWCGVHNRKTPEGIYLLRMDGSTPLIAAMRCYVASKLGDEVEIPEELT